jgi:hypothetical protein
VCYLHFSFLIPVDLDSWIWVQFLLPARWIGFSFSSICFHRRSAGPGPAQLVFSLSFLFLSGLITVERPDSRSARLGLLAGSPLPLGVLCVLNTRLRIKAQVFGQFST